MTLAVVFQHVDGYQRIVHVSELISDNEDFFTNGENDNSHILCCVYGNCTCNSLDHALANLTSSVLINITTDMTLFSLVKRSGLQNVSIIGYNNPTVHYKTFGGMHFTFCQNWIIQGITWDGCGNEITNNLTEPGIKLTNSSNVTIQNCCFQNSIGQALILSEVSGDVNINYCNVENNSHYRGHGAAIHYSYMYNRNISSHHQFMFTMNNCNFANNKHNKSLVYINNRLFKYHKIIFNNSIFSNNQGVSIYVINHKIHMHGKVLFQNNSAKDGAGIYITDHSTVMFDENANIMFNNNVADGRGGAILLENHSICLSDRTSMVTFNYNKATKGGAICSFYYSTITFEKISVTMFYNNTALYGGAFASYINSQISFKGNSITLFSNNAADYGGAIDSTYNSHLSVQVNSTTLFSKNTAYFRGGSIHSYANSYITFKGNSTTVFNRNTAVYGGGIKSYGDSFISFEQNSVTEFSDNTASRSGAMHSEFISHILFQGNSSTVFINNNADYRGGAIYSYENSYISFKGYSVTKFINNTACHGHAIHSQLNSYISFEGGSTIVLSNNIKCSYSDCKSARICKRGSSTEFTYNAANYNRNILSKINIATITTTIFCTRNSKIIVKGHSSIIFKDILVKWCTGVCLPYPAAGETDAVVIDNNGIVWCNNLKAFNCLTEKCYNNCQDVKNVLGSITNNQLINITDEIFVLSSVIYINAHNISIIGHNNPTVFCVNDSGLQIFYSNNLTIKGITWIGCGATEAMYTTFAKNIPVLFITKSHNVIIQKCSFLHSVGQVIRLSEVSGYVNITNCIFMYNDHYKDHGTAIELLTGLNLELLTMFIVNNCDFRSNKGADSIIYIMRHTFCITYLINSNFYNNGGISIYLSGDCILYIIGDVLFESNVAKSGAGIYITDYSTVMFGKNSNITFINNTVHHNGAAIFLNNNSSAIFDKNSVVMFYHNKANNGIVYSNCSSTVMFEATCKVTFKRNSVTQYGAAIYSFDNSQVLFTGNATVNFNSNIILFNDAHLQHGGTIFSENNGYIVFEENSVIEFRNNSADFGSAIFSINNSNIIFKDSSRVMFNNNVVHYCGILTSAMFSYIIFTDTTNVTYDTNTVSYILSGNDEFFAGSICTFQRSEIIFTEHSLVTFINNKADRGAAMIVFKSNVIMNDYARVIFNNNFAVHSSGGAFVCSNNSNVTIKGNSNVTFNNNKASQSGGAIHSYNMCRITFKDNSASTFTSNTARDNGGAILSSHLSEISFEGSSTVTFYGNTADNGGVFYINNSSFIFKESSLLLFNNNKAREYGGIGSLYYNSKMRFEGTTTVRFENNQAE